MPAGDSITQGEAGDRTWRYHLWTHLAEHGEDVEFVGPHDETLEWGGFMNNDAGASGYHDPDFDRDHNSQWGRTVAEAKTTIEGTVDAYRPDLIIVQLGVNDLFWPDADPSLIEQDMRDYLAAARRAGPDAEFAIVEVLPTRQAGDDPEFAARADDFNRRLRGLAAELSTEESSIVTVDVAAEGFAPDGDTKDGTHPDPSGELKIAAAVSDTLDEEFALGARFPRPLPDLGEDEQDAPAEGAASPAVLGGALVLAGGATLALVLLARRRRRETDPDGAETA